MLHASMDLVLVSRLLRYGAPDTRTALVKQLLAEHDSQVWQVLAHTAWRDPCVRIRVRCLEALATAATLASREVADEILDCIFGAHPQTDEAEQDALSQREWAVANLVARGLSNAQIAAELSISTGTVRTHVQNIRSKLSLKRRAAIGAWVGRNLNRYQTALVETSQRKSVD